MRLFLTPLLLLSTATVVLAQGTPTSISISEGATKRASTEVMRTGPYQKGPWAAIPATPAQTGTASSATDFRIRAWQERDSARVVVYAVTRLDSTTTQKAETERETQIAALLLSPGQSYTVSATEQYDAKPVTVSAPAR
jgi:hypothetical protein